MLAPSSSVPGGWQRHRASRSAWSSWVFRCLGMLFAMSGILDSEEFKDRPEPTRQHMVAHQSSHSEDNGGDVMQRVSRYWQARLRGISRRRLLHGGMSLTAGGTAFLLACGGGDDDAD